VAQITYPNGTIVTRNHTPRGQLESVGWGSGATSYVYLRDGRVDYQARTNDVTTSYEYDGRGMIGSVRHTKGGHDLAYRQYWRDDRDRILAWKRGTDQSYNQMEDGRGNRYHYDPEGQLDLASYRAENPEDGATTPYRNDSFQYDKLGNRMGSNYVASRGSMNFTRKDTGLNQYSAWWPYSATSYDDDVGGTWGAPHQANGVLMQDGWITAGFNALNQPISMWSPMYPGGTSAQWMWFGYDPLGRCVKRWVSPLVGGHVPAANTNPATYYYYDGWNMIQEGASGGTDRVYVHGGRMDEIVASWAGGGWSHHQYDAQGNCLMLTDTDGGIREQYDYDAFGMPYFYNFRGDRLGGTNQWGNRFLFTGREWLKDLKVYDYRARMYQPELGRFLQPDPMEFEAGDYNLYRYCHNDPVNKSDPMGLFPGLTNEGGGDWIKGSDGLSAWDRDHGMPSNPPGGGIKMAPVFQTGPKNAPKGIDQATIGQGRRILAQQTKEGEDSTGSIVDGKVSPGDRRPNGEQVPYRFGKPVYAPSGNSVLAARKILYIAEPVPPGRSDLLTHYHTRYNIGHQKFAEPTPMDANALKTTRAMLFSNPYLKAEGAYRIYRNGVSGYETRHDLYDP